MKRNPRLSRGFAVATCAALTLTGCLIRPPVPPAAEDEEPPTVTLSANGQTFRSDEEPGLLGPCVETQRFPTTVAVAANDLGGGGVARVVIRSLGGLILNPGVAPDSATTRLEPDRSGQVLEVTARPPAGTVQPNLLVSFTITGEDSLSVGAFDTAGNVASLPSTVDIREAGSPIICRGEE